MRKINKVVATLLVVLMVVCCAGQVYAKYDGRNDDKVNSSSQFEYYSITLNTGNSLYKQGTAGDHTWLVQGTYTYSFTFGEDNILRFTIGNQSGTLPVTIPDGYTVGSYDLDIVWDDATVNSQESTYDCAIVTIDILTIKNNDGEEKPYEPPVEEPEETNPTEPEETNPTEPEATDPEPKYGDVSYHWDVNGGPGLPDNFNPPAGTNDLEGVEVDVDETFYEGYVIEVEGGYYTFSGWDEDGTVFIKGDEEIIVHGVWTFTDVEEPTEPEIVPTEPEETKPTEPEVTEPTPTEPEETKPTEPTPTEPEETKPSDPLDGTPVGIEDLTTEEANPTEPATEPEETSPTEPIYTNASDIPKTGDSNVLITSIFGMVASSAGAVALIRKRKIK